MATVRISDVSRTFGDTTAVRDLDLDIADGEFFVLLGPTGAGKTTSLRLVAGLETPDEGALFIGDADVTHASPADRDVTFVFQQYSLYPNYTVFENLAFPLRAPGRRLSDAEIQRRTAWVGERLGITDKFDNRATELSGGEMQRVALGRAIMRQPAVHLMDEPLSSLDAKLREALRSELKALQTEIGSTILYVTHDQSEALALADRVGVLGDGELLQVGSPEEIYRHPDSVVVARQLGSPAVNILPCDALNVTGTGASDVGLRPEDITLGDPRTSGDGLVATVRQVERLGAENTVILTLGGRELRAMTAPELSLDKGTEVSVQFLPEDLLYFDRDGRRLTA